MWFDHFFSVAISEPLRAFGAWSWLGQFLGWISMFLTLLIDSTGHLWNRFNLFHNSNWCSPHCVNIGAHIWSIFRTVFYKTNKNVEYLQWHCVEIRIFFFYCSNVSAALTQHRINTVVLKVDILWQKSIDRSIKYSKVKQQQCFVVFAWIIAWLGLKGYCKRFKRFFCFVWDKAERIERILHFYKAEHYDLIQQGSQFKWKHINYVPINVPAFDYLQ